MSQISRKFIIYGAILMALAVGLGAFGAHILKDILTVKMLKTFNTGVEYQFYHALGLFAVAWVASQKESLHVKRAGYFMLFGTLVFSGSLYLLAISSLKWLGAITPIGGLSFILAWIFLALSMKESSYSKS